MMTPLEIDILKNQLKSSFAEYQQGRIYFISKFLLNNKQSENPINALARLLPTYNYSSRITWDEIQSAVDLWENV